MDMTRSIAAGGFRPARGFRPLLPFETGMDAECDFVLPLIAGSSPTIGFARMARSDALDADRVRFFGKLIWFHLLEERPWRDNVRDLRVVFCALPLFPPSWPNLAIV